MVAFAANSLLCRSALGPRSIDAATFAVVRLVAGATVLWLLALGTGRGGARRGDWLSAAALAIYAVGFSFAYLSLAVGTGALILFGAVQVTMIVAGLLGGERFGGAQVAGTAIAFGGLAYLVSPGVTAPAPLGAALMALAGVAWGAYSLRGRRAADALAATRGNFIRAVPLAVVAVAFMLPALHATPRGLALAAISGAIASGLGYVLWYAALRALTATQAAVIQLSAPVLAALGGSILLSERVTARLVVSSIAVLGGIALAIASRRRR